MSTKLKRWTKEEVAYIKNNYYEKSPEEIGEYLGRTRTAVIAKAHDLNLTVNTTWSKEDEQFIIDNHQIMTRKEMAIKLNRTETAIDVRMSRLGLLGMKHIFNRDFFEVIDTEEKAYWLGFIFADGCVYINDTRIHSAETSIQLQESDASHLRKFNKSLQGNLQVGFKPLNTFNKPRMICYIRCYSYKMAQDLISHGCVECKSFVVKMPTGVPKELLRHFIRGYYDGNGCICLKNTAQKLLGINFCTASKDMVEGLRECLFEFGINSYIVDEKGKSTYRLYVCGMRNVDNMLHFMYDDSSIYLDRKYEKAKNLYEKYDLHERLLRHPKKVG